jgi:activating signal cointegrator 1
MDRMNAKRITFTGLGAPPVEITGVKKVVITITNEPIVVKILSLRQPWASLVAIGVKVHETRAHRSHYRGPLLIHAAKRFDPDQCSQWLGFDERLAALAKPRMPSFVPRMAIVALAEMTSCTRIHWGPDTPPLFAKEVGTGRPRDGLDLMFGDWTEGGYAYGLENVRPLPTPILWPGKPGKQGMRNAPPELIEKVRTQFAEATIP